MRYLLTSILLFVAGTCFADPPRASHDYWRNTNYPDHYVLYDHATRTWVETIGCHPMYRFRAISNELNVLTLYDDSRAMTVRLTYGAMELKAAGAANFSAYQNGTFDTRDGFSHEYNGQYTGSIVRTHGCQWEEHFPGQSGAAYRFVQTLVDNGAVEMYDQSRDMSVRLEANRMLLRTGRNPYQFFKHGSW